MIGHLALTGDLAQFGTADMAHAFFVQRLVDCGAHVAGDAALLQGELQFPIRGVGAHVGNGDHFHALIVQIQCSEVAVIIAGQHHSALARLDCVELHQALHGTGQHYAGQIVVTKNHRLIE